MPIVIQSMREEDLEIVSELAVLANPHATKEKYREHVADELKENPDLAFVAVDDDKVVGYVQGDTRGSMTTLEDLAVAKGYQGKGVGKQLLKTELEALKKRGAKIVFAEVHYKNARAIPFYYMHGFRISGFLQDYFGIGHDAIVLKLVF
ncbi:MAG: GNAT family N-acetyltransferase [Candidatus Bathyarchaeota archaeon]|nr:GNAT family N-acetyltransferase [Candidatus Bathyarchaeota archaeon]